MASLGQGTHPSPGGLTEAHSAQAWAGAAPVRDTDAAKAHPRTPAFASPQNYCASARAFSQN